MTNKAAKNKDFDILDSPLINAINVIEGKWKIIILYKLYDQTLRFGELKKSIPKITQKMLTQKLRELEVDGLITRLAYNEIPPRVEYNLTDHARDLGPILCQLGDWGSNLKENKSKEIRKDL